MVGLVPSTAEVTISDKTAKKTFAKNTGGA